MKQSSFFLSLKRKKAINHLFSKGSYYKSNLFNACYLFIPHHDSLSQVSPLPIYIVWAMPKSIRKAYDRNQIKRVSRSAFFAFICQLNEDQISHDLGKLHLAFIANDLFKKSSFSERIKAIEKLLLHIHFIKK